VRSEWDVYAWGADPDITCTSPALCNYTVQTQILGPGDFTVELYVRDTGAASDTDIVDFTLLQDASASFQCSLNQLVWQDCTSFTPSQGERVYFQDQSTPSQGASSIVSWDWTFESGNPSSSSSQNSSVVFGGSGAKSVTLVVTDNLGRQDTYQTSISFSFPFPSWEEVSPF
jgi:hypothetical protein